ncbi:MAG: F0F1 ATP synthase subunit epsilon [Bacillales bacterium]|nr:F0F1 ATP synthase subunit epsilon [Bacillales bacterium]
MKISFYTPEGLKYSGDAIYIEVADKKSGSFSMMENHVPVISVISEGYIRIEKTEKEELYFALAGALLEQEKNNVKVVAEILSEGKTKEEALSSLESITTARKEENKKRNVELAMAENELKKQIKKSGAGRV